MEVDTSSLTAHPRSRGENQKVNDRGITVDGSSPLTRGKLPRRLHVRLARRLIPAHAGKTMSGLPRALRSRAHPRSRGENASSRRSQQRTPGSSPLTRGKHLGLAFQHPEDGLIPAHAGKTPTRSRAKAPAEAHPRSRGENITAYMRADHPEGSSPLTRGKRRTRQARKEDRGLIPAHAGKTSRRASSAAEGCGSSPLTRGKLDTPPGSPRPQRLIPAHAGKTAPAPTSRMSRRAHPRSRGENTWASWRFA